MERTISKILSPNDIGKTGSHQSGILVPKSPEILSFFPELQRDVKNPRAQLRFADNSGEYWEFVFIYYNSKLFGGTRNEYRLTRITGYFGRHGLDAGDELLLSCAGEQYFVSHAFQRRRAVAGNLLVLGNSWRVVPI